MSTKIKAIVSVSLMLAVVLASLSMTSTSAAQGDSKPTCETTYHNYGNGIASSSHPLCGSPWIGDIEGEYILPTMTQLNLATLYWTDHYGRGNSIRRTFDNAVVDLSDKNNWVRWVNFSEQFKWYVIGSEVIWGPGAAEDLCGFQVRSSDNAAHYFTIMFNQNNQLVFREYSHGNWESDWRNISSVVSNQGRKNTLVVYVMRSAFFVFVNGNYVARFDDNTNADGYGWAGLGMETFDESGTTYCTFEKAWVWTLDGWDLE